MQAVIEIVRSRTTDRPAEVPVSIFHQDLSGNDFASLFALLESSPASYLRGASNVYAYAVGRSFYEQVFPPDHVCLGWSGASVHWLSGAAPTLDYIWIPLATG